MTDLGIPAVDIAVGRAVLPACVTGSQSVVEYANEAGQSRFPMRIFYLGGYSDILFFTTSVSRLSCASSVVRSCTLDSVANVVSPRLSFLYEQPN